MDKTFSTDRRAFLKAGSVVAAPFATFVPAVAFAGDDRTAKLARLEDEKNINDLQRKLLRYINSGRSGDDTFPLSSLVDLGEDLRVIAEDTSADPSLTILEGGKTAINRFACRIEREAEFTGTSVLEKMARLQGHGSHRTDEQRLLVTEYIKDSDGWHMSAARLV